MTRRSLLIGYTAIALSAFVQPATEVASAQSSAKPAPNAQRFTYRRSRELDITGANPRDSIVLTATGPRADSVSIAMTFYASGVVVHRQRWTSDDELFDEDSLRARPEQLNAFMRKRLDTVLALVKRQPINREQVKHMGDEAVLRAITPRPTHQIMLSFGFESSMFFTWDAVRRKLVLFMECC